MRTITLSLFFYLLIAAYAVAQTSDTANLERQLIAQLNQSRADARQPPLKVEDHLTDAAREHSRKMADANTLAHVLPDEQQVAERLAATGLHFNRSGENVGYNTDFKDVNSAFMKSPPHRENMLSPNYTQVGVGIVRDDNNVYWITEDFAHGIVQYSAAEAEDMAAQSFDTLRSKSHQAKLSRLAGTELEDLACKMGKAGKLDSRLPGVRFALAYSNSHPEDLPSSANKVALEPSLRQYAVGACFAEGKANLGGMYYVVMAFY